MKGNKIATSTVAVVAALLLGISLLLMPGKAYADPEGGSSSSESQASSEQPSPPTGGNEEEPSSRRSHETEGGANGEKGPSTSKRHRPSATVQPTYRPTAPATQNSASSGTSSTPASPSAQPTAPVTPERSVEAPSPAADNETVEEGAKDEEEKEEEEQSPAASEATPSASATPSAQPTEPPASSDSPPADTVDQTPPAVVVPEISVSASVDTEDGTVTAAAVPPRVEQRGGDRDAFEGRDYPKNDGVTPAGPKLEVNDNTGEVLAYYIGVRSADGTFPLTVKAADGSVVLPTYDVFSQAREENVDEPWGARLMIHDLTTQPCTAYPLTVDFAGATHTVNATEACEGGTDPEPTPTPTPDPEPTPTPTPTPEPTPDPTPEPTVTPSPTPSPTPTVTTKPTPPVPTPSATATPSTAPSAGPTGSPSPGTQPGNGNDGQPGNGNGGDNQPGNGNGNGNGDTPGDGNGTGSDTGIVAPNKGDLPVKDPAGPSNATWDMENMPNREQIHWELRADGTLIAHAKAGLHLIDHEGNKVKTIDYGLAPDSEGRGVPSTDGARDKQRGGGGLSKTGVTPEQQVPWGLGAMVFAGFTVAIVAAATRRPVHRPVK